jgi:Polyketide cyclase / dehydrase and lipid transport
MLIAQASTDVAAPLAAVRAVVLDPRAYTEADTKVDRIVVEAHTSDGMLARIHGHLGPFRSSILARYTVRDDRVDLDMLQGLLRGFHADFLFQPIPGGVRLTHREQYDFGYGPLSPLVEAALRRWAHRSIVVEVEALKQAAEASGPSAPV